MNTIHYFLRTAMGTACVWAVLFSTTADAKGHSPAQPMSRETEQRVEKRLSQIEEQQLAMRDAMAAELQKLRADLDNIKGQQAVKTSFTPDK